MPRPLRIEYENAYYHVMNRGIGRQHVFHGEAYFNAFLSILEQVHRRSRLQILSYCLMRNHYHLLAKTSKANLGRAKRRDENVPRRLVMYLAQEICGLKLQEMADYLGLKRTGIIPTTVSKLK